MEHCNGSWFAWIRRPFQKDYQVLSGHQEQTLSFETERETNYSNDYLSFVYADFVCLYSPFFESPVMMKLLLCETNCSLCAHNPLAIAKWKYTANGNFLNKEATNKTG